MQGIPCSSAMWSLRVTKSGAKWKILRLEMRSALRSLCLYFLVCLDAERLDWHALAMSFLVSLLAFTLLETIRMELHQSKSKYIGCIWLYTIYLQWRTVTGSGPVQLKWSLVHSMTGLDDALSPSAGFSDLRAGMFIWFRTKQTLIHWLICLSRALSDHARIGDLLRVVEEVTEG